MQRPHDYALLYYGTTEVPGRYSNPAIQSWMKAIGAPFDSDEVSWCGVAMAYWHQCCNMQYPDKPWVARRWLKYGEAVSNPVVGDIVVLWRGSKDGWQGHVGFYINESKHNIRVLGGNQDNRVCIKTYDRGRVLEYRRSTQDLLV